MIFIFKKKFHNIYLINSGIEIIIIYRIVFANIFENYIKQLTTLRKIVIIIVAIKDKCSTWNTGGLYENGIR